MGVRAGHSRFSPSASERWMACPGSIALAEKEGIDRETVYAWRGSVAHKILELALRDNMVTTRFYAEAGAKCSGFVKPPDSSWDGPVTEDMTDAVDFALSVIREKVQARPGVKLVSERKLGIVEADGLSSDGTADIILYEDFGELEIIDYKNGSGVIVDAEDNSQLKAYGLGAVRSKLAMDPSSIRTTIIQPNAPDLPVKSAVFTPEEIAAFGRKYHAAMRAAVEPNAPRIPGEAQCRWCPAAHACPELKAVAEKMAVQAFDAVGPNLPAIATAVKPVPPVDVDELARVLALEDMVVRFFDACKDQARGILEAGGAVPGFKLVLGDKHRVWSADPEEVLAALGKLGLKKTEVLTKPKLLSPAQAEKIGTTAAGKEAWAAFAAQFITKPQGEPKLVQAADKRPAWKRPEATFDAVDPDIDEFLS